MVKINWSSYARVIWFSVLLLVPIAATVTPMEWLSDDGHSFCLWRNLTGYTCYGCGMTRAVVSMCKLNFSEAWNFNHLIVIVFPLVAWLWARELKSLIGKAIFSRS